jgi:hypothetical protein
MLLDKNDLYVLRRLASYKSLSIFMMLAGGAGAIFGISMAIVSHRMGLNIALTGASLVILTSNCLCYCYITVLDKIITSVKTSFGNDKLICTK